MSVVRGDSGFVLKLLAALGAPAHTKALDVRIRPGEVVTVRCEYYPDIDQDALLTVVKNFELHEKEPEVTA